MTFVINSQVVLSHAPEGPLAGFIGSFADSLSAIGYGTDSVHYQARIAACFSQWLELQGVDAQGITPDHLTKYLRYRIRHRRPSRGDHAALVHLLDYLRREGATSTEAVTDHERSPIDRCADAYAAYLLDSRALAKATVVNYLPFVQAFLKFRFGGGSVEFSRLRANDIVRFVRDQAPRLHRKRAKLMTSALRSFLGYAQYCGEVNADLVGAVPVVPNWSMATIPRAIAPEQVHQLLTSIDRRTGIGRRDYAVLLLLARLGLRSGEVASLTLDDIDWETGQLAVRGKGGRRNVLPMTTEVGKAIAAYLTSGRPDSSSRCVFLRARAPVRGFQGSGGVGTIVRHSLQRIGIDTPSMGAHQFRHGLATEMLRHGASLGEIGDVLGHRHSQTTAIYAKVDIDALRSLALPWPGGAR